MQRTYSEHSRDGSKQAPTDAGRAPGLDVLQNAPREDKVAIQRNGKNRDWTSMTTLSIGQLAKAAEVGIETIRFYEREGLLEEPPRRRSGYRQYPPEAVTRVRFIRRAKDLGFSLKEIGELLRLQVTPGESCGEVRAIAQAKIQDVEKKIFELTSIKRSLETLVHSCDGKVSATECPVLDALASDTTDTED